MKNEQKTEFLAAASVLVQQLWARHNSELNMLIPPEALAALADAVEQLGQSDNEALYAQCVSSLGAVGSYRERAFIEDSGSLELIERCLIAMFQQVPAADTGTFAELAQVIGAACEFTHRRADGLAAYAGLR